MMECQGGHTFPEQRRVSQLVQNIAYTLTYAYESSFFYLQFPWIPQ